jgi:superfamily II helicase
VKRNNNEMTNILKDNKGNAYRIELCKYCTDYKGKPKPIMPEDMSRAIRMPDGSYKCEPCQIEEIQNKIVKVTPNSESAKRILAERASKQKKDLELKRRWEEIRRAINGRKISSVYDIL